MTSCPSCTAQVNDDARFCPSCGTALVAVCPSCGAEARLGTQFCASCGHRLDLAAPRQEERRFVTILFADLTGSTALGEQLDPERLRVLLGDYFKAMADVIESWGGTVEKFVGDAVMAVFGIPTLHEDDSERALRAALAMHDKLAELNPEVEERHGVLLEVRIGVCSGDVISGTSGDQLMVTGDAVNVAARLQQSAEPGEVIVGERTYLAARGAFAFEEVGYKSLKGKALPVTAWRLTEVTEQRRPRGLPGMRTRVIGREREFDLLHTLYASTATEKRPRLVTILGLPGIGKSRLTEEFIGGVVSDIIRAGGEANAAPAVHVGGCLPYGQGITYWPLREILWATAGITLDDPAVIATEKLEKIVVDLVEDDAHGERDRVKFALAKTAGITLDDNPLDRMTAESVGDELGLAWPRFISGLAADRPLIMVIEDLHWAESPLLDMLEHLVARSSGAIFLIVTARPEFAESRPWASRTRMSQIGLEPLTEDDSHDLLDALVPHVGGDLKERIASSAEGNPFFAEEIVGHLIDQGILYRVGEEVQATATPGVVVAIPDTVRAVLAARIDALSPEEKGTLQDASVVGRTFWATALDAMGDGKPVRTVLRALEDKGLLVSLPTSSLPGQLELSFKHVLTRDVAYESIPKARRARSHAAIGEWIEELASQRREEFIELIAHHYEVAAQPENADLAWPHDRRTREGIRSKAIDALLATAEAARMRADAAQAVSFAVRALALTATDEERLACLESKARGEDAALQGDAWTTYLEAFELARSLGYEDVASEMRVAGTLFWARYGGTLKGTEWRSRAVQLVEERLNEIGEDSETFEAAALLLGRSTYRVFEMAPQSEEDAARAARQALVLAEKVDSPFLLYLAIMAIQDLEESRCDYPSTAEKVLELARRIGDINEAHEITLMCSLLMSEVGRHDRAESIAEEAFEQAQTLTPHRRIHTAHAVSQYLLAQGRFPELYESFENLRVQPHTFLTDEGGQVCGSGAMALARLAVACFEREDKAGTVEAIELMETGYRGRSGGPSLILTWDTVRPIVGAEESRRKVLAYRPQDWPFLRLDRLRSDLQVTAVLDERERFSELAGQAHAKAGPMCAPWLTCIADWGDAMFMARDARYHDAAERALDAMARLDRLGQRYRAARLLVDLLPLLDAKEAHRVAEDVVPRLEEMGAGASAAQASSFA
ncbi:MAG: adenylate/guanylate cyclase domain-containing protein [Actinomycetota bacterium]